MQKVTLKAYAKKHKLSLFNVMKMVKSEKVTSEEVEIDGKKTLMILMDTENEKEIAQSIVREDTQSNASLQSQITALQKEFLLLRKEVESLKEKKYGK